MIKIRLFTPIKFILWSIFIGIFTLPSLHVNAEETDSAKIVFGVSGDPIALSRDLNLTADSSLGRHGVSLLNLPLFNIEIFSSLEIKIPVNSFPLMPNNEALITFKLVSKGINKPKVLIAFITFLPNQNPTFKARADVVLSNTGFNYTVFKTANSVNFLLDQFTTISQKIDQNGNSEFAYDLDSKEIINPLTYLVIPLERLAITILNPNVRKKIFIQQVSQSIGQKISTSVTPSGRASICKSAFSGH